MSQSRIFIIIMFFIVIFIIIYITNKYYFEKFKDIKSLEHVDKYGLHCSLSDKNECTMFGAPSLKKFSKDRKMDIIKLYYDRSFRCFNKENAKTKDECLSKDKDGVIGVYDTHCRTDKECPFYKANKNYPNTRGRCLPNGTCELPINMKRLGFRQFRQYNKEKQYSPLCHNCENTENCSGLECSMCCDKQTIPDYAFSNDLVDRLKHSEDLKKKGLLVSDINL